MRFFNMALAATAIAGFAACSDDSTPSSTPDARVFDAPVSTVDSGTSGVDSGTSGLDASTASGVSVNFSVDDSINQVYTQGDLVWKGSFIWDSTTNSAVYDGAWSGPYAALYDDGPVTAGGHEPPGAVAGDHKWGVQIKIVPPATGMQAYDYGLDDTYYDTYGNGWVWLGSNGQFIVQSTSTGSITAQGQTFTAFGTHDLRLTLDLTALASHEIPDAGSSAYDTSVVKLKSSAWGWSLTQATVADNKAVVLLSSIVGTGHTFKHTGLLNSGDKPEWVWTLGAADDEYRDQGIPAKQGVTVEYKDSDGNFQPLVVGTLASNMNTYVTIP